MDIELVLEANIASGFTICAEAERSLVTSIPAEPALQLGVSSKLQEGGTISRAKGLGIGAGSYIIQHAEGCLLDGFILPDRFHHHVRLCKCLQRGLLSFPASFEAGIWYAGRQVVGTGHQAAELLQDRTAHLHVCGSDNAQSCSLGCCCWYLVSAD